MSILCDPAVVHLVRRFVMSVKGPTRRLLQATICEHFGIRSGRKAESIFNWNRNTVARGLQELYTGQKVECQHDRRGRPRVETKRPEILSLLKEQLDEQTQADPKFQSNKLYTRMTGNSVRTHLAARLGVPETSLPSVRTNRRVLNRNGYMLKRLRKTLPQRKIKETNAIFDNVKSAHARASNDSTILRVSIDTKAKVKIGSFDRGGKTRDALHLNASDHDMGGLSITPCGLLELASGRLHIDFVGGPCTSDTIADQLERWWEKRRSDYPNVTILMIDLDNGPEIASRRTQFMNRLIQWSDRIGKQIELVYYPPYHSKYNRIERCWSSLEQHWNGAQLRTVADAIAWASTMTWKGITPIVERISTEYAKGVKLTKHAFASLSPRLRRSLGIEKWSVTITPGKLDSTG